jgi:C_GCAxxG_C_C family probable redox protein
MKQSDIEKNAKAFFESGFNCAESVLQAIVEAFAEEGPQDISRIASAFGGGIGGSHESACGALTGGVMAIGYLMGRVSPLENVDDAKTIAREYQEQFKKQYGTANCAALLDQFGPQDHHQSCQDMVGAMAGALTKILKKHGLQTKR